MAETMDEQKVKALATELVKGVKTQQNLGAVGEADGGSGADAELGDHLGYDKHAPEGRAQSLYHRTR